MTGCPPFSVSGPEYLCVPRPHPIVYPDSSLFSPCLSVNANIHHLPVCLTCTGVSNDHIISPIPLAHPRIDNSPSSKSTLCVLFCSLCSFAPFCSLAWLACLRLRLHRYSISLFLFIYILIQRTAAAAVRYLDLNFARVWCSKL